MSVKQGGPWRWRVLHPRTARNDYECSGLPVSCKEGEGNPNWMTPSHHVNRAEMGEGEERGEGLSSALLGTENNTKSLCPLPSPLVPVLHRLENIRPGCWGVKVGLEPGEGWSLGSPGNVRKARERRYGKPEVPGKGRPLRPQESLLPNSSKMRHLSLSLGGPGLKFLCIPN